MVSDIFTLTLVVLFASALLGAFLRTRARDRCLKDFEGHQVNIQETPEKRAWGHLMVYPNGVELIYQESHRDAQGHIETSMVYYREQLQKVRFIMRAHDELSPSNQERRAADIRRTYRPGLRRRLSRSLWNTINSIRDAVMEALGMVIGRAKSAGGSGSTLLQQDKYLAGVGKDLLGHVARAYDPILERYIGRRVVVELAGPDGTEEFAGILKEYSQRYLEVLNVRYPSEPRGRDVDLILPRPAAALRHGGETVTGWREVIRSTVSGQRASL